MELDRRETNSGFCVGLGLYGANSWRKRRALGLWNAWRDITWHPNIVNGMQSKSPILRYSGPHYHLHFLEPAPDVVLDIIIEAQLTAQTSMSAHGRPTWEFLRVSSLQKGKLFSTYWGALHSGGCQMNGEFKLENWLQEP